MFHRASSVAVVLALPLFAAATAVPRTNPPPPPPTNQCNTGPIQCCNSVQNSNASIVTTLIGLLGIVVPNVGGQVGLTCSPLSVVGVSGNSCSAQPVCCSNNQFSGLINFGCSPININL